MGKWYAPQDGWAFSTTLNRSGYGTTGSTRPLIFTEADKKFLASKCYRFRTKIDKSRLAKEAFTLVTPWGDEFTHEATPNFSVAYPDFYLDFYSSPPSDFELSNENVFNRGSDFAYLSYYDRINSLTTVVGIEEIEIKEIDWRVYGYSWLGNTGITGDKNRTKGWEFATDAPNVDYFKWYDNKEPYLYPAGLFNSSSGIMTNNSFGYRDVNHISKYIDFGNFNLSFSSSIIAPAGKGIRVYLSENEPYKLRVKEFFNIFLDSCELIATLHGDGSFSPVNKDEAFLGLTGNRYIMFVADSTDTEDITIIISNLSVEGGYADQNNRLYEVDGDIIPSITGVTYSSVVGTGNTIDNEAVASRIFARIGNGAFKSGIWENGVWNNGWRKDDNCRDFDNIDISIKVNSDVRWQFRITGPEESILFFNLGDEVTIGNIIAIDINENRKIIKDKYRIIAIDDKGIVVELNTTFPIRRIEKDSNNHRIKITKNSWLSGAFLNGYFTGVWNYGLYKGFPLITEMFETHWIDGIFDGGHFNSERSISGVFSNTTKRNNKLCLIFSDINQSISIGDTLLLDMIDKTINVKYNDKVVVLNIELVNTAEIGEPEVFILEVTTSMDYGIKNPEEDTAEEGSYVAQINSGIIQNMNFDSNNVSKVTSFGSMYTNSVFSYISWIDVNYDQNSAVNIGRPQTKLNVVSKRPYSINNLYGYPTYDVLSSRSTFRDSYTLDEKEYKLGTKFKVYNDFIGESSKFTEYFDPTNEDPTLFEEQGWTFSEVTPDDIIFSRTADGEIDSTSGEELRVITKADKNGILDLIPTNKKIIGRTNESIEKNRYTVIEFDLLTYSVFPKTSNILDIPYIHFNNTNNVNREEVNTDDIIVSVDKIATYLPIYKNIDHTKTDNIRKVEYFYNKKNLSMNFSAGVTQSSFIIDNLKMKEIDMVPFFQYFIDININKGIQIPYQGIAPYIDYDNDIFNFIDNINFGLDSISIESTYDLFTGTGSGVISNGPTPPTPGVIIPDEPPIFVLPGSPGTGTTPGTTPPFQSNVKRVSISNILPSISCSAPMTPGAYGDSSFKDYPLHGTFLYTDSGKITKFSGGDNNFRIQFTNYNNEIGLKSAICKIGFDGKITFISECS